MISNEGTSKPRFRVQKFAIPLLLVLVALAITISDARKQKTRGDFSEFTLRASRVMFAGGDPYNKDLVDHNYKYFPTNAIIIYPLSWMSVYAAQGVWFAVNLGLLIWAFKSLRALLMPLRIPWWVPAIALAIMFRIIVMNMRLGQWNTSVFCLSIIGLRYLHQGARLGGSTLLALAITLKYMPVIFLGYLAARRCWKDFGVTCIALLFWILLLPVVTLGPTRTIDLMRKYYADSVTRVETITEGKEVNSYSVHSVIYRTLSPVAQSNDQGIFYVNFLDLPRKQGALIAKTFSIILLLAGATWLLRQHRFAPQINELGTLLLIGLCYMLWFLIVPGVRHAQLISTIPMTFALAAAVALAHDRRVKLILAAGLFLVFILITSPAELVEGTTYNRILEVWGVLPLALVVETVLGLYAFKKLGIGNFVRDTWQLSEDSQSLVGDPRY